MREQNAAYHFYVALVVLALALFAFILWPFVEALFLAAVLAGALYPWQQRLAAKLRGRKGLSAILLSTVTVVLVLGPTAAVSTVLVKETVAAGRYIASAMQEGGVAGLVDKLPEPVNRYGKKLLDLAPIEPKEIDNALHEKLSAQQDNAGDYIQRLLGGTFEFLVQIALLVIALYFMLVDGPKLVAWCEDASPLKRDQTSELLREFKSVSVSVIVSSLATGVIQTAVALVGYLIAGVPKPWLFAVVTFFMSFVPAIGAGGTSFVATVVLLGSGKIGMAIFLGIWGTVAVALADNLVKPLLAKDSAHMHGAVLFFALVGGMAAFGAIGLIVGPLIVSFLLTLVRLRKRSSQQQLVTSAS
ncbi:MAG TPA: AI-2E family transporter [Polyangiales bacterium]|jgi:predicted PurR-regulated permease PerM|nr:AI-2E family transporter [Polyangiales bacterium]